MIAVEIIKVIKIDVCEGKGTEKDPCRKVYYYYTASGELLFKNDHCYKLQDKLIEKVEEV